VTLALIASDIVSTKFSTKTIAVMGVLTAIAVVLRPIGAGVAGIEPIWLIIILTGRALGAAAGFVIGCTAIIASAFVSGGVGPWLPYQMMVAAWIGMFAGLLPRLRGKFEAGLLAIYGFFATFLYGWLLNLWFWPTAVGLQSAIDFDVNASTGQRLISWVRFSTATSLGFDIPRAILTAALLLFGSRPLLAAIRRGNRAIEIGTGATEVAPSP